MRLAYADPPYLGCCRLYGHRHEAPWGCWDDLGQHAALLRHLDDTYDGWAYSMSAPSVFSLASLAPEGARMAAWSKSFAAFKKNVRCAYTWEPVIFKPGRDKSADGAPVTRDHLVCPITMQMGLTGAKPQRFAHWVLALLGYLPGDDFTDLFPGTGVMGRSAEGMVV